MMTCERDRVPLPMSHSVYIRDEFLAQLKDDLVCRRVGSGMARLNHHRVLYDAELDLSLTRLTRMPGACLAIWPNGWTLAMSILGCLKQILLRFQGPIRAGCPYSTNLNLRLARHCGDGRGIGRRGHHHFDAVRGLASEANDSELLAIAAFWRGRCCRMQGEYDQALALAIEGREQTLGVRFPRITR